MEMEKKMFGQVMFAGPSLTMEHGENFDQRGFSRSLPLYHT